MRTLSVLLLAAALFAVSACVGDAVRIDLLPQLEPPTFVPGEPGAPLVLRSFTDVSEEQDIRFLDPVKEYRFPLIEVLNDTLLLSLRASRGFRAVSRDRLVPGARYDLSGQLLSLETSEPYYPFEEIFHPEITAELALRVVVRDLESGEILADETVSGRGLGHSESGTSYQSGQATYYRSFTDGYQQSISQAIAEGAHRATHLVLKVAGHEPPTEEEPVSRSTGVESAIAQKKAP